MDEIEALPPIEAWWPELSVGARHALLDHMHGPLPQKVRDEIARITGRPVAENAVLAHAEIGFVETQQQSVD